MIEIDMIFQYLVVSEIDIKFHPKRGKINKRRKSFWENINMYFHILLSATMNLCIDRISLKNEC